MSYRTRRQAYEYVRNSIWIVPLAFMVLAVALGLAIPEFDQHSDTSIGITFGVDAARSVLGAISGGMITFTGFVFSILLLAVQFGSSQFSPRMLRRFLRDPTTKFSLGLFMATFVYALVVLRVVGTADNENFVPSSAVSVALLFLVLSMLMFLRLISRTTGGLRVAAVLAGLGADGAKVLDRLYPDPVGEVDAGPVAPPDEARPVMTVEYRGRPGILQGIDSDGLLEVARQQDAVIELVTPVGNLLVPGEPLFRVHGGTIDAEEFHRSIAVGDERTMQQDPTFIFRLLADISSKALSPGVNDPTTSSQALDQIELLLRLLAQRRLTPGARYDDGKLRAVFPAPSWEDFLHIALDETRYFGATSVQITRRLRALLEDLHRVAPEHRRPAIDAQLELLDSSVDRSYPDRGDRALAAAGDRQGIGSPQTDRG
jgi:uncharacterized membrane protein